MSRTGGVLTIILLALACAAIWLRSGNEGDVSQVARSIDAAPVSEPLTPGRARVKTSSEIDTTTKQTSTAAYDRYRVAMDDPLLEPRSDAEVEWLRKNKYPNAAAQADAARFASELDFDHRDGVEAVEILAAEQFANQHPDNRSRAVRFLNEAAVSGSTYALEALARLSESPTDPVTSEAYYRALGLRGDWNANLRVKPDLTRDHDILADLLAHQIIDNLQIQRRQRGLAPLCVDLRPGLGRFLEQVKGAEQGATAAGP